MLTVHALSGGYIASDCYLCVSGQQSILIDPSVSISQARQQFGSYMVMPSLIVLTHAHFDHALCLDEWRKLGIPLATHIREADALADPQKTCFAQFMNRNDTFAPPERLLEEGDVIQVGQDALTVMHTPGHTVGSICLIGEGLIFTGDTVFTDGGFGRTDLWGGSSSALWTSLHRLRQIAQPNVTMYPGHGPSGDFLSEMMFFERYQ